MRSSERTNGGRLQLAIAFSLLVAHGTIPQVYGATAYWHAQGTTANWSDAANWDNDNTKDADTYTPVNGDSLVWNANSTAYLNSTNDLVGLSVNGMDFSAAPGAVTIRGNALTLGVNYTPIDAGNTTVALELPLVFGAGVSYFSAQGTGLTINGVISQTAGNASAVQVDGAGYVVNLNGLNTFSGRNNINEGTVCINTLGLIGNAQSLGTGTSNDIVRLGYRVANADLGNLVYTGPATTSNWRVQPGDVGNYTNVGGGFINNGSGSVTWTGALVTQSPATTGRKFLTLGGTNADTNTWQAVIRNVSVNAEVALTKTNAGKWILTGTNTYSGPTTVSGGTLLINGNNSGATGAVTVASGATLGGTSMVGGAVSVAANGALAPGSAGIGTFTVTGAVTLAEGAVYAWEYQDGAGDCVALTGASGTLTLPSVATVQVSRIAGALPSPAILFTATTLAGAADLSGWIVTGVSCGQAKREGTSIILEISQGILFELW